MVKFKKWVNDVESLVYALQLAETQIEDREDKYNDEIQIIKLQFVNIEKQLLNIRRIQKHGKK